MVSLVVLVEAYNGRNNESGKQYQPTSKDLNIIIKHAHKHGGNRELNNEHVIGELETRCVENKDKTKWKMKSGSAIARKPVTSTAERHPKTKRGTDFGGSRDSPAPHRELLEHDETRKSWTAKHFPNPDDAGQIVPCLMSLPK